MPVIELRTFNAPGHSVTTRPRGVHSDKAENILLLSNSFSQNFRQRDLYKVDRALLNVNFKNDCCFDSKNST